MTRTWLLLVLSLSCLALDARAGDEVHEPNRPELRDALFKHKDKFPLVDVKTVDPNGGAPVWMAGTFNTDAVVIDGKRFAGFRFKAQRPAKDVDFVWGFQPTDNVEGWFIEAENGEFTGFCEYGPRLKAIKGPQVWTQPLLAERFQDGGEYLIWFAFKDAKPAEIRFTFLFRKLERIEMEEEDVPPPLTDFHAHFSDWSIREALGEITFGGVGAGLNKDEKTGRIVIESVVENGAAHKVGLLAGDEVLSVDGRELTQLTLEEATALIKGEPGSTFNIVVFRPSTGMTISGPVKRNFVAVIDTGE